MISDREDISDTAATYQGLDPAMTRLRHERIPFVLRNTGDSTMRLFVPYTPDRQGPALTINRSDDAVVDGPDGWDVLLDPAIDAEWQDVAHCLTADELVALIRDRVPAQFLEAGLKAQEAEHVLFWETIKAQGLEPLRARLEEEDHKRADDLPWTFGTDGPLWIVWIPLADESRIGITRTETPGVDPSSPDGWNLWFYESLDAYQADHGIYLEDDATAERTIALIDAHLHPEQTRARLTDVRESRLKQDQHPHTMCSEWQEGALYGLLDTRDVPVWMRRIDLSCYSSTEVDDLILLACTYPLA